MLPPIGSVGSYLRLDGPSRQRLHVHRLVLEPVALLVPERVLEPVRIVAAVIVGAVVRAARLASRLRGDHRGARDLDQSEEHTSELQTHSDLVCRLLLEKKNK